MAYSEVFSPNKNSGNGGFKKSIIIIHTSEPGPYAPGKNPGTAIGLGRYLASPSVQASYHLMVDPNGDVCRGLVDADRAWAAGGIANNEGYHICAVGWSAWSRAEWLSMPKMLDSLAAEIARWCKIEGIPPNFVPAKDLPNDVWGITGHGDTAVAWRQTDHTDPGKNFPYDVLLDKVKILLGQKPVVVKTDIQIKRDQSPWLGSLTIDKDELIAPDGVGRYAVYENGSVYWTPLTGAHALSKDIVDRWGLAGFEAGELGYPVTDVFDLPNKADGRAAHFQGASIYISEPYGARVLKGAIKNRWAELDYERSFLGMPKSDEIPLPDKVGVLQDFAGGIMYHSPSTGAHPIIGLILEAFRKNNYEKTTGYPLGGEIKCPSADGVFQVFEFAHAYYKFGEVKGFMVDNDFLDYYGRMGYEAGKLSFPIGDKKLLKDNIWRQDFLGGSIEINRDNKSAVLIINGETITV